MGNTTNLNLETHNRGVDLNRSFESYRLGLNGPDEDSNMMIIDEWAGSIPILLMALNTVTSGSITTWNSYINAATGSATTIKTGSATVDTRFVKIDEFSGSGQADFNNISQDYSHVMILGTAAVNRGVNLADVGCDFNADSGSSNYSTLEWTKSGSAAGYGGSSLNFDLSYTSQILLGSVPGSPISGYGGTFFAVIPNYSGSSGFYKTGIGASFNHFSDWMSVMKSGGYWTSTSPITRIRIFGSDNTVTRYDFLTGTKISLYGFI